MELSAHSRLMGGQFPTEKQHDAFKNPIFYAGNFFGIFKKNELSFLMVKNPSFYTVYNNFFTFYFSNATS